MCWGELVGLLPLLLLAGGVGEERGEWKQVFGRGRRPKLLLSFFLFFWASILKQERSRSVTESCRMLTWHADVAGTWWRTRCLWQLYRPK